MPSRCGEIVEAMAINPYSNFIVGLDGSANSDLSFDIALALRKTKGHIVGFHIEDPFKTDLPSKFKWSSIHSNADTKLVCVPTKYARLETIIKSSGETTKEAFNKYVHSDSIEMFGYVCIGIAGRKGPKDDPTILGQVADLAMRSCSQPVIVCREPINDIRSYVVFVDETDRSMMAYEATLCLKKSVDTLKVVFCSQVSEADRIDAMKKKVS